MLLRQVSPREVGRLHQTCKQINQALSGTSEKTAAFWRWMGSRWLRLRQGTRSDFARLWHTSWFDATSNVVRLSSGDRIPRNIQSGTVIERFPEEPLFVVCGDKLLGVLRGDGSVVVLAELDVDCHWFPSCVVAGGRLIVGGANPGSISTSKQPVFVIPLESLLRGETTPEVLHGHTGRVVGMAVHKQRVVSVSWGGEALVWNVAEGMPIEQVGTIVHGLSELFCVAICDEFICLGSQTGASTLFRAQEPFELVRRLPPMKPYVLSCSFHNNDSELLMSDSEGLVRRVQVATGEILAEQRHGESKIRKVLVTPRGQVVCGCGDGSIRVLNLDDLVQTAVFQIAPSSVRMLLLNPSGNGLVVGLRLKYATAAIAFVQGAK